MHATSVGRAALGDAVLACLARRPRDIPSTLGYFHATSRRHGERVSSAEYKTPRLSMPIATVTRRRSGSDLRPSRIKLESSRTASGIVGISLDLSSIRGRDSRAVVVQTRDSDLQRVWLYSRLFLSENTNSNAMQNPFSKSLGLGANRAIRVRTMSA